MPIQKSPKNNKFLYWTTKTLLFIINVVYLKILRRSYDVFIGKVDDYEVDFVAINNNGRLYVQVADTLKGVDENDTKIFEREIRSLKKIDDNYEKIILTSDKIPAANEDGIKIYNVLDWLLEKQ